MVKNKFLQISNLKTQISKLKSLSVSILIFSYFFLFLRIMEHVCKAQSKKLTSLESEI